MVSLLDIVPATENVPVAGDDAVKVRAVSAKEIAEILARYPILNQLFAGRQPAMTELIRMAPEAMAAVIAASQDKLGDPQWEAAAAQLPLDTQADLLAAIMRCTLPRGIGPFVEKLKGMGLFKAIPAERSGKAPSTPSQKASNASSASGTQPAK